MNDLLIDKWSVTIHCMGAISIYKFVNGELLEGLLTYKSMKEAQEHCDKLNA